MTAKLNLLKDADCRNATSAGKAIKKFSDGGGLQLWVHENGSKYWRLRYWLAGKEKSLSLGVYPEVTLKAARKKRQDERQRLESGLDPSAERKAWKTQKRLAAENSFESVAREWYEKQLHTWAKHHADDVLRRLERNLFPDLGMRPIAEIEAPELLASLAKVEKRGAYDLAHRILQVSGQVFRYGVATGRCKHDLSADLRGALTPHKAKHQPAVRPEHLPQLLRAVDTYEEFGDRLTKLALQLLSITFVRTSELIGAEWKEFDLDGALWVIPAERMKMKSEHIVPLSKQALVMLAELKPLAGVSRYVFPGRNADKPISNNTMLFALYRLGYKGKMTGHGFRAVASTILNEQGYNSDVIERQLAHCERNEVRGAYNRAEYLPQRMKLMQEWADYLDKLKSGADVIQLRGNAA
ncbi:MAG: integrase arm-type DNA-binding domain-containing protein [Sterolibacterium sp.]